MEIDPEIGATSQSIGEFGVLVYVWIQRRILFVDSSSHFICGFSFALDWGIQQRT